MAFVRMGREKRDAVRRARGGQAVRCGAGAGGQQRRCPRNARVPREVHRRRRGARNSFLKRNCRRPAMRRAASLQVLPRPEEKEFTLRNKFACRKDVREPSIALQGHGTSISSRKQLSAAQPVGHSRRAQPQTRSGPVAVAGGGGGKRQKAGGGGGKAVAVASDSDDELSYMPKDGFRTDAALAPLLATGMHGA